MSSRKIKYVHFSFFKKIYQPLVESWRRSIPSSYYYRYWKRDQRKIKDVIKEYFYTINYFIYGCWNIRWIFKRIYLLLWKWIWSIERLSLPSSFSVDRFEFDSFVFSSEMLVSWFVRQIGVILFTCLSGISVSRLDIETIEEKNNSYHF